jgi:hypothetical protein
MAPKQNEYDDDDGRVICSMDVEGMRWHEKKDRREEKGPHKTPTGRGYTMTKTEARQYTFYSLLACLVIVVTFSLTWVLFTLFCTEIWLK